jgi:hypothetical protein
MKSKKNERRGGQDDVQSKTGEISAPAAAKKGPGRPPVPKPDGRIIHSLRRRDVSWRAMASASEHSSGVLRRTYDEWLRQRGLQRATKHDGYLEDDD